MEKTREELVIEAEKIAEEIRKLDKRRNKLGDLNWAVDRFHSLTCRFNHDDGCGYYYDSDESFDREGSNRNAWKRQYQGYKKKAEQAIGENLTHERFLKLIEVLRFAY